MTNSCVLTYSFLGRNAKLKTPCLLRKSLVDITLLEKCRALCGEPKGVNLQNMLQLFYCCGAHSGLL